jgi:benzoylformate decarboxylase
MGAVEATPTAQAPHSLSSERPHEPLMSVRDLVLDLLRSVGMTTIFANPGSTEIPFLVDLPKDFRFVLGLHEASVVGMATGWSLVNDEPALVNLHTTAGLGNAVGAIATARVNRAPLVILVGQQDRRHLALEPFLAGRLNGLAGEYPVWADQPVHARDVPGAIARARHEAQTARGPAIVIVPMDDWLTPADSGVLAAPKLVRRSQAVDPNTLAELAEMLSHARSPAIVAGAGADGVHTWSALVELAERLGSPVLQESFGARVGFPQDHPLFAGHLPSARGRLRRALVEYDVILAIGAPVFREHNYEPGTLVEPGKRLALITDDPAEAHRSPVEVAVLAPIAAACRELAAQIPTRKLKNHRSKRPAGKGSPPPPRAEESLRPGHVLSALAELIPRRAIVIEETPSSRSELEALLPVVEPFGQLHAAMGGLGFALPAAVGIRMANPGRPVIAIVGDGSALYAIQSLWSATHYKCGVLFIVMANGRYAVMDHLAQMRSRTTGPWPAFEEVSVSGLARSLGCPAERIDDYARLVSVLESVLPGLESRDEPLLLDVGVAPNTTRGI